MMTLPTSNASFGAMKQVGMAMQDVLSCLLSSIPALGGTLRGHMTSIQIICLIFNLRLKCSSVLILRFHKSFPKR